MMHNYPEMLSGIIALMTGAPAIGCILQIIPMAFYKLSDKKVDDMIAELKVRRAASQETQEA